MSDRWKLALVAGIAVAAAALIGGGAWLLASLTSDSASDAETATTVGVTHDHEEEVPAGEEPVRTTDRFTTAEGDLSFPVKDEETWPWRAEPQARSGVIDYWIVSSRPGDAYRAFGSGTEGVMVSLEKVQPGSANASLDPGEALSTYEEGFGLSGDDGPCAEGYFADFPDVQSPLERPGAVAGAWDGCPNGLVERNYAFETDDGRNFVVVAVRAASGEEAEALLAEIVAGLQTTQAP